MTVLSDLAARASTALVPKGSGPYQYVRTENYNLSTDQTTSGELLWVGERLTSREVWTAADGSGRILLTRRSQPDWVLDAAPAADMNRPVDATAAPDRLVAQLQRGSPGRSAGQWLTAVRQIWSRQVVPPALQEALLTIVAGMADVTLEGAVTDRAGRPGVAISAVDRSTTPLSAWCSCSTPTPAACSTPNRWPWSQAVFPSIRRRPSARPSG